MGKGGIDGLSSRTFYQLWQKQQKLQQRRERQMVRHARPSGTKAKSQ